MGGLGVKVQHFPLTLLVVLTTLTLPCERDKNKVNIKGKKQTKHVLLSGTTGEEVTVETD